MREKSMPFKEFAEEILGRDTSLAHQNIIDMIEHLDNKYGAENWQLCFGRRNNSVVVIKHQGGTDESTRGSQVQQM